jgi:hypothetical protein
VRHAIMILGVALIMAAIAILGHDCQASLERGAWSSTTIVEALNALQLKDNVFEAINEVQVVRSILSLPFFVVSMITGVMAFSLGCILGVG